MNWNLTNIKCLDYLKLSFFFFLAAVSAKATINCPKHRVFVEHVSKHTNAENVYIKFIHVCIYFGYILFYNFSHLLIIPLKIVLMYIHISVIHNALHECHGEVLFFLLSPYNVQFHCNWLKSLFNQSSQICFTKGSS